jgi:hypothetical protein
MISTGAGSTAEDASEQARPGFTLSSHEQGTASTHELQGHGPAMTIRY